MLFKINPNINISGVTNNNIICYTTAHFSHCCSSPSPTAPIGQPNPTLANITASSVYLSWGPPDQPNGIITNYSVHQRSPSLLPSPARHDVGVSFNGNGYATFTPSSPSSFNNELSFRFRTLDCCGIMFYSINTAQTDVLAVELRNGIPWFIFDAGSGPGAIKPEGDTKFNDGSWHTMTVSQSGSTGTISVDNLYMGSGNSLGTSSVVGYAVHYVGGIPSDAPLQTLNGDLNPSATLSGGAYAGCLFDVVFNGEAFDFTSDFPGVGVPGQGCPVDLVTTAQLLGGGYFSLEANTITGNRFNISFRFRTTHSDGLLFFMYANDDTALGIELSDSNLHVVLSGIHEYTMVGELLCDGEWHSVMIAQDVQMLSLSVNDEISDVYVLPSSSISFSSRIFFGGVPLDSTAFDLAQDAGLNTYAPFSGCIRMPEPLLYVASQPVAGYVAASELVNFDGCGDTPGTSCTAPWTEIDTEMDRSITNSGLTPFSGIYTTSE